MSNSSLVDYTLLSPNHSGKRLYPITKITIHHMSGNLSVETCGQVFQPTSRQASSNYGVGSDGRIGLYVDESCRAWTSANADNDNRAVTIEVANDQIGEPWHVSDEALKATIELCIDICKRNGIKYLTFTGDATGTLTMHRYFAATDCPGTYLASRFPYICKKVNNALAGIYTDEDAEWKYNETGWWWEYPDGSYPKSKWKKISDVWFYFNDRGYAVTGWQFINNKWYYFNEKAEMITGWIKYNNDWYYLNDTGDMHVGWKKYKDKWYYLSDDGKMSSDEFRKVDGYWYKFDKNGTMLADTKLDIDPSGAIKD